MKLHISDLLEDYREDSLIKEENTPLSLEEIRRRTLEAVAPRKKRRLRRTIRSVLLAAVIVCTLAGTALAGERELTVSDWFREALNQRARKDAQTARQWNWEGDWSDTLTGEQLAVINDHGRIVDQTISGDGGTITLAALYGDEYVLNLYLRMEAPEGTVLPDDVEYSLFAHKEVGISMSPVHVPQGYTSSENYQPRLEALPDEDPGDSRKDFLLTLHHEQYEQRINGELQKPWAFHDEVPKTIPIRGLFQHTDDRNFQQFLSGRFDFDITNPHEVTRLEIDVTGCDYDGYMDFGEGRGYGYSVEPIRLALSPFTVEMENRYTCTEENRYVPMSVQVVMKDGTTERCGRIISIDEEEGVLRTVEAFLNPISLDQIDYLLIGDPLAEAEPQKVYP